MRAKIDKISLCYTFFYFFFGEMSLQKKGSMDNHFLIERNKMIFCHKIGRLDHLEYEL